MESAPVTPVHVMASKRRLSWLATTLVTTALALLALAVWAVGRFDSIQGALKYASGETLLVDAATKTFGTREPGEKVNVAFKLINSGNAPIRIVGSRVGCSCTVPDELPFSLAAGERRLFQVSVSLPKEPQGIQMPVTLFTNIAEQPELELTIVGEVGGRHRLRESD